MPGACTYLEGRRRVCIRSLTDATRRPRRRSSTPPRRRRSPSPPRRRRSPSPARRRRSPSLRRRRSACYHDTFKRGDVPLCSTSLTSSWGAAEHTCVVIQLQDLHVHGRCRTLRTRLVGKAHGHALCLRNRRTCCAALQSVSAAPSAVPVPPPTLPFCQVWPTSSVQ